MVTKMGGTGLKTGRTDSKSDLYNEHVI